MIEILLNDNFSCLCVVSLSMFFFHLFCILNFFHNEDIFLSWKNNFIKRMLFNNKTVIWQYNHKLPLKRPIRMYIEMVFNFY